MAIDFLKEANVEFEVREYLKDSLSPSELEETIEKLNISPTDLLRKQESDFKSKFKGKELSDNEWIKVMVDFPKLMERPVVINQDKAVIARPAERIKEIL